ncbi:putative membrane-anchored protein [Mycobacterium frederiksbergense]|uniref:Membrane-anchored protein n=1 Tax=Mycolicibacterium frederiksbergense TaxID=117567 RepID=A0ABT6L767_9MYCO|nr:hypothetical protein [Mycolicibacterium frederiksbergense]MDH6198738.1 putative membrane-anchored protein [Mycolicibacterium frederiksbergense]
MATTPVSASGRTQPALLSKVPEVTVWFWVIKILCTTVGESFADWINMTLGVGLITTALTFTAVLAGVLIWQVTRNRYVPFVYWLTVVTLSVTGTLYTDILTDALGVPLALSSTVFALILAMVFAVWFARERTLSIHSIVTLPREAFYWLAVLVTFALGTAAGDWTLQLTGWSPGTSVLLPVALIVSIVIGWRLGANPVASFWLAYILTRPLGANLGDWLATPRSEHGLGIGTALTSAIFLAAILVTVTYLSLTRSDIIDAPDESQTPTTTTHPARNLITTGYYTVIAIATAAVLAWAAQQPHAIGGNDDEQVDTPSVAAVITADRVSASFPESQVHTLRDIAGDTLTKVKAGDHAGATDTAKDLETTWDEDQSSLQPLDEPAWTVLDGQIDDVLKAVRSDRPDPATEIRTLQTLLSTLG